VAATPGLPRSRGARLAGSLPFLPPVLALALYAPALGVGYLADDFLYLNWMRGGVGALLRHVTTGSNPQMIRPLPALAWTLGTLPRGAVLLHALSLLLHAVAGLLVAVVIGRAASSPPSPPSPLSQPPEPGPRQAAWRSPGAAGVLFASLFVAFPLSSEPVVWLSAGFDLWATVFALLAVCLAIQAGGRAMHEAAAALAFLLALLSKESVLCLPLVIAVLLPWRAARRTVGALAAVALSYLAFRVVLFHGPGGYLDSTGRSALWSVRPGGLFHSLLLRLPLRILVPFRDARELPAAELAAGVVSAALLGPLLAAMIGGARGVRTPGRQQACAVASPRSRLWNFARPWLAGILALAPALPVFSIEADQENSRLLYFPAAVFAVACGLWWPAMPTVAPWVKRSCLLLALYWSGATLWNGRAWTAAGWEVERTLQAMAQAAPRLPAHALVFVAGHDTWHGAFTWRNAIADGARWRRVRPDLRWFLGTVAGVDRPAEELGKDLFEIGIDTAGRPVDWTSCEAALLVPPKTVLAAFPVAWTGGGDPVTPPVAFLEPLRALQVRVGLDNGRPENPVAGRLFWRPARGGRFNMTDSAPFFLGPRAAAEIVLRVPPELAPPSRPLAGLTLWLHLPPEDLTHVRTLRVARLPPACEPGSASSSPPARDRR
jgi:hypothetical protein